MRKLNLDPDLPDKILKHPRSGCSFWNFDPDLPQPTTTKTNQPRSHHVFKIYTQIEPHAKISTQIRHNFFHNGPDHAEFYLDLPNFESC